MSQTELTEPARPDPADITPAPELPEPELTDTTDSRLPRTFAAFSDANYRWFFAALCGNFASMNMQMFVRGWLVFEITGSYQKLGWMTAAGGVVGLFAAPIGGVVADRVRQKKHVIQYCQTVNSIVACTIAVLISLDRLTFMHLLI
ncbi:MAG: MFS transporter, partial [Pseudomonadales bacterium]|nr:MFS transporter [Pseudomonadales bacterium]